MRLVDYLVYTLLGFMLITLSSTVSGQEWFTTLQSKIPAIIIFYSSIVCRA